jgi:hypothetical protein
MCESRCPDLAPVWPLAAVWDNENTHLSLRRLNGAVSLTRWDSVALAEEQEVVNEGLHVLLHGSTWWRSDLVVFDLDGASRHVVQALVNDAKWLTELLHTAKVAVVAVTVDTNGNVEVDFVVCVVGLRLSDIPWYTWSSKHDTGERVVDGVSSRDDTNTLCSANPDTVVGQHLLGLVDTVTELGSPLVDVVEKADGKILRNATGANIGGVETGTRDTLIEFLQILAILPPICHKIDAPW